MPHLDFALLEGVDDPPPTVVVWWPVEASLLGVRQKVEALFRIPI